MFANLPTPIKRKILTYLETDNFRAAKELHDSFMLYKINKQNHPKQDDNFDDDEDEKV